MPPTTYRIRTDKGTFDVSVDREATPEEIQAALSKGTQVREAFPRFTTPPAKVGLPEPPTLHQQVGQVGRGLIPQTPSELGRLGVEVGAATLGGVGVPALVTRLATLGSRALAGLRVAGTAAGAAGGSLAAEPFDPSVAPQTQAVLTGALAGGGEVAARGVGRLLGGSQLTPEGRQALDVLRGTGALPTPGQVSKSRAISTMEGVAESSLFGGGQIQAAREAAEEAAQAKLLGFAKRFPQRTSVAFKTEERRLYDQIPDFNVNIQPVLDEATRLLDQQVLKTGPMSTILGGLSEFELSGIPFKKAQGLRSDLLALSRVPVSEQMTDKAKGAVKRLAHVVDEAIETSAPSPQAVLAFREANAFAKLGSAGASIERLIREATLPDQSISGRLLLQRLRRSDPRKLSSLSAEQIADLTRFAEVLTVAQQTTKAGFGRVAIPLKQAGIVSEVLGGAALAGGKGLDIEELTGPGAILLGGPAILAQLLTRRASAKVLTDGLLGPRGKELFGQLGKFGGLLLSAQAADRPAPSQGVYE